MPLAPRPCICRATLLRRHLAAAIAVAFILEGLAARHGHDADTTTPTGPTTPVSSVSVDSGSNLQEAVVGHAVHVAVTASDAQGQPLASRSATWRVETGGGSVSVESTVTDEGGHTGVGQAQRLRGAKHASSPRTKRPRIDSG